MLTVTNWEQIRRAYHVQEKSINEIMRETGHAFRTVKKMVESDQPPNYNRKAPYRATKLGPYREQIKGYIESNKTLPRKQRWTAPRIYQEIVKAGYTGAESTVRHYVAQVRKLKKKPKTYLPLEFDPGTDAQVDWGEGEVIMNGKQITVQLFVMTLSYSRRTFMMAFPTQRQEAFFAGHVAAFDYFNGIPQRISYDNLKTAVKQVLEGSTRVEQEAFFHFRGYYLFDSHYCTPAAGHEKGQVEHRVGYGRRNYLVPLPEVSSFEELNAHLLACCQADDERTVDKQPRPIGQMWAEEQSYLRALPQHQFDCARTRMVMLNKYSQVQVDTNRYSVPCNEARKQLTVKLYPFEVKIYQADSAEPIAVHPRCYGKQQEIIDPLHYLPLLTERLGAFEHAKPLRQWRKEWPPIYEELLAHLRQKWPDGRGLREFIRILQLHLTHQATAITEAIEWALAHKCAHYDGIQLWLTQLAQPDPLHPTLDLSQQPRLAGVGVQPVNVAAYDQLVRGTQ